MGERKARLDALQNMKNFLGEDLVTKDSTIMQDEYLFTQGFQNNGVLLAVIPGALIFKIVVIKLTAPSIDEAPAKWSEKMAMSTAGLLCHVIELKGG